MSDGDWHLRESEIMLGRVRLLCRSITPAGPTIAHLAIIHGYGEHSARYLHFMRWLAGHGVACTTLDQRGHGLSSGRRGYVGRWEEYLDDLAELLKLTVANMAAAPGVPLFVMGHSHGGLIAAAAGQRGLLDSPLVCRGCILSSPFLSSRVPLSSAKRALARVANGLIPWLRVSSGLRPQWLSQDAEMVAQDRADPLLHRSATPRWFFTMSHTQRQVADSAAAFKLPLLCLIAEADSIANPATAHDFFARAGSPDKSVYAYPHGVHELLRDVGRQTVFRDILGWMKARIPAQQVRAIIG